MSLSRTVYTLLFYTQILICYCLMDLSYQTLNAKARSLSLQGLVHQCCYINQIAVVHMQGTRFASVTPTLHLSDLTYSTLSVFSG